MVRYLCSIAYKASAMSMVNLLSSVQACCIHKVYYEHAARVWIRVRVYMHDCTQPRRNTRTRCVVFAQQLGIFRNTMQTRV
jgi:hypothetical protein